MKKLILLGISMRNFLWTMKWLVNGNMVWESLGIWQEGRICGDCFKYKFFRCDGRRGDILFLQKNLQVSADIDFR